MSAPGSEIRNGVLDTTTLPRWGSNWEEPADAVTDPKGVPKFPFREDFNKKIAVYSGNFVNLAADVVVCPTNERMDDVGGPHEVIRNLGGERLAHDLLLIGPCRMSESKVTRAYNISSR